MLNTTSSFPILIVSNDLCANCRSCQAQRACRVKALRRIDFDEPPFIDSRLCRGCRICMADCPSGAIIVQ